MYRLILLFILSLLSQGFVSNSKYNLQSQDSLVATVYGSQTLFYNHVDRQNNVRIITDHDRRPIEFYSYTPYGERIIHTRWFGQNRTTSHYDNSVAFTGRYHDKETGLYYFRARYYDSEQGRFISRDPAGYVDGMGLYNGYFANHFGMDPSGEKLCLEKQNKSVPNNDIKKTKKMLDKIRNSKNPDGTPTQAAKDLQELEANKHKNTVKVGPKGNSAEPKNKNWKDTMNGQGEDSNIYFDPNKKGTFSDGTNRDPTSSLAHENSHARSMNDGKIATDKNGNFSRKDEEVNASKTENEYRKSENLPQRKSYGKWPIK